MPSFTATDQILYAPSPGLDVDGDLFLSLLEETYLLVQSCTVSVDQRPAEQRFRPDGTNFLYAADPGQLVWEVEARTAHFSGLADYHPGAILSRQALAFANGPDFRIPFQFQDSGVLVYERPRETRRPGTLPEIAFAIRQIGSATLDESSFPTSPTPFVELEFQSAVPVHDDALNGLLLFAFQNTNPFASAALTLALYDGDPEAAGTLICGPLNLTPWTDLTEPDVVWRTLCRNHVVVDFTDTYGVSKSITHAIWKKNAIKVAVLELDEPVTLPAGKTIRVPIGALGFELAYPMDGTVYPDAVFCPGHFLIAFLTGARTPAETFDSNDMYVEARDVDALALEVWTVPRDADHWAVSGTTVAPADFISDDTAPGPGWAVRFIFASREFSGPVVPTLMLKRHTANVTSGNPIPLDGSPLLDLTAAPVP